jgi:hypothetical protein
VSTPLDKKVARKVQIGHEWVDIAIELNGEMSPILTFRPWRSRYGYSVPLSWVYAQAITKAAEGLREERRQRRATKRIVRGSLLKPL